MTKEKLKDLCDNFDGSQEQFKKIVLFFLQMDKANTGLLADKFSTPIITPPRWIGGTARPHPRIMSRIVLEIKALLNV